MISVSSRTPQRPMPEGGRRLLLPDAAVKKASACQALPIAKRSAAAWTRKRIHRTAVHAGTRAPRVRAARTVHAALPALGAHISAAAPASTLKTIP